MNWLGYDVQEWVAVITIVGGAISLVVWIVKETITKPSNLQNKLLNRSINELSRQLETFAVEMKQERKSIYKKLEEHDRRLDSHDRRLDRHHEKIKTTILKEKRYYD